MKENFWFKTILFVYKYLDNLAEAIDNLVERQALNSFYYFSGSSQDNSVMAVSDRIINLIDRKKKLINIKVLVSKCLRKCDKEFAQILIEKYIDNDKSEDIALRHNLSMRTYFRRLIQAEEQFASKACELGFNESRLNILLANEKWIKEVYNSFLNKNLNCINEKQSFVA